MSNSEVNRIVKASLLWLVSNPISAMGTVLSSGGLALLVLFTLVYMSGAQSVNPYYAALGFLGLPLLLLAGVGLIVLGRFIFKGKVDEEPFWIQSLNIRDERKALTIFVLAIMSCVVFFGLSGAQAAKFMDSDTFCGQTCHSVMEPESVMHKKSVHAATRCVRCHVGEGVHGLLVSKMRGAWQVVALMTNHYKRPVSTPVISLPSSEDTCKTCHDTDRKSSPYMKLYTSFKDDKVSSREVSAVVMNLGSSRDGAANGIHAHSSNDLKIRYYTLDEDRRRIAWVEATTPVGTKVWSMEGELPPKLTTIKRTSKGRPIYIVEGSGEMREMDCVDCHNRVGHSFLDAVILVDEILAGGNINPELPYAKKVILKALESAADVPKNAIAEKIYSELSTAWPMEDVDQIAAMLSETANKHLYPRMNIGWEPYEDMNRHSRDQGCFRCHNQRMKDATGKNLSQQCDRCHVMVADHVPFKEWERRIRPPYNGSMNKTESSKGVSDKNRLD